MVFRKKTDKGSVHENEQAQYGHSEPYMNMPYGGAYPNKEMPFRPSTSREVTGPIYDPRQREMPQGYQRPAQPPHGNGMYGPMYPQRNQGCAPDPYDNTAAAYPQTPPYMNAYGQGGAAAAYPQNYPPYDQGPSLSTNNRAYDGQMPRPTLKTAKHKDDLKSLSFWQDDDNPNYQDDGEDVEEGTSPAKFVLSILIMVVLSVIVWLGYRFATQPKNNNIPLIQAETNLYKHRPENPGGEFFPHQDMLVYNQLAPNQGAMVQDERIMSQDYAYPTPEELQQHYPNQGENAPYPQQSYGPEYGQQQPVQPAAPNSNQDYVNPQAQNFQQQPQQQVVSPAPVATNMQPVQENSQQVNDALPKEQSGDAQQVMPSAQNDPMTSSADAAKNEPSAETIPSVEEVKKNRIEAQAEANQESAVDNQDADSEKQMKPIQTQATPLKAGYYIQLGSVMPNAKSVESEWHRLRRKYTSELGSFKPIYKNVDVGVRKKYRLLIGPFSHRNSALKKCMRIGNGCRVLQVGSAKR